MANSQLFYLCESEKNQYINNHRFYVEQSQKRLLSQFDDLDKEANDYAEKWLDGVNEYFDPESHDPSDFLEQAYDEGIEHGMLLSELRTQTMFSVVAGMYHQWEKVLREWMVRDARYWGGENLLYKLWKVDIGKIFDFFESMDWNVREEIFFKKLDACRLIVNVYKHGNGGSLYDLRHSYPEYFYDYVDKSFESGDWYDHTSVILKEEYIQEFSESIVEFWNKIPERFFNTEALIAPEWVNEALKDDAKGKKIKKMY